MVQVTVKNAALGNNAEHTRRSGILYLLVFAFLAVIIIAAGLLSYRNYKSHFLAEAERDLTAIAELKVNELANWRRARMNDGLVFYRNSVFSSLVRRYFERPEDKDAQYQLRVWLGHFQVAWKYDRIMLLNGLFEKTLIFPPGAERSVSYVSPVSAAGLRAGKVVFEDFYWNKEKQKIYLKILVPILDSPDGSGPLAVLALRLDPDDYLYPLIRRWPTPSRTAETLLVRRDGDDALFLNDLDSNPNSALKLRISLKDR